MTNNQNITDAVREYSSKVESYLSRARLSDIAFGAAAGLFLSGHATYSGIRADFQSGNELQGIVTLGVYAASITFAFISAGKEREMNEKKRELERLLQQ